MPDVIARDADGKKVPILLARVKGKFFSCSECGHSWLIRKTRPGVDYECSFCPVCLEEPTEDAIEFGSLRVCTTCKDQYVQQLQEGMR